MTYEQRMSRASGSARRTAALLTAEAGVWLSMSL
jgi:hypothetical protein